MPVYSDRRMLPYRPDQMYDLVLDVENYPDFLPWCKSCQITSETADEIFADVTIGFKFFSESFSSKVTFESPEKINVTYLSGPFKYLRNTWKFTPSVQDGVTFCIVDFNIEFEFKSRILQGLIQGVFSEAVQKMVRAFETRAEKLYNVVV